MLIHKIDNESMEEVGVGIVHTPMNDRCGRDMRKALGSKNRNDAFRHEEPRHGTTGRWVGMMKGGGHCTIFDICNDSIRQLERSCILDGWLERRKAKGKWQMAQERTGQEMKERIGRYGSSSSTLVSAYAGHKKNTYKVCYMRHQNVSLAAPSE